MSDALPQIPPQIPAGEYPQRWRRVQQLMVAAQLDLLIAYADDRAVFGPAHARWLANFPVHFEPMLQVKHVINYTLPLPPSAQRRRAAFAILAAGAFGPHELSRSFPGDNQL